MENKNVKPLKEKLLAAINRVLKSNKSEMTNKMEKIVKKSIKKITKKADQQLEINS